MKKFKSYLKNRIVEFLALGVMYGVMVGMSIYHNSQYENPDNFTTYVLAGMGVIYVVAFIADYLRYGE